MSTHDNQTSHEASSADSLSAGSLSAAGLTAADDLRSREALAQMLWTGGIIGFFLIQAIIWAVAIAITHSDPSHAVIADRDERIGSWQRRREVQVANERLGWQTVVEVVPAAAVGGQRQVQIRLQDPAGKPVLAEQLEVTGYHRARVTEKQSLPLEAVEPGVWRVTADLKRAGWWRFEGQANRGTDEFQFRVTEFLSL